MQNLKSCAEATNWSWIHVALLETTLFLSVLVYI